MNFNSLGQTIVPAQDPDILLNPQPGIWDIENTGCDIRENANIGGERGVMVYDGSSPYFHWFDNGISDKTTLNQDISDPDIVITTDGIYALLVYEDNGDIFLKIYEWINNAYSQPVDYNLGSGNNPNIDISFDSYFAITWADDLGNIKSVVGDYSSGSLSLSGIADITNNDEDRTPDVAIFELYGKIMVKYTYISMDKDVNTETLKIKQADYSDVFNNIVSSTPTTLKTISAANGDLGRPRIAAPPYISTSPHHINDYMIVIDYHFVDGQTDIWEIRGFNTFNNTSNNDVLLNQGVESRRNSEPVVTYAGDFIVISWTSDIHNNGAYANEVVSRKLINDGNPMNNIISVVNYFINEYQYTPSIAGRFSEGEFNLHHYVNEGWGYMEYKITNAASTVLRKNTYVSSLNVYINTISDNILEINTEIQDYNVYIYNNIGQLIISKESISSSYQLSIGDLPIGMYIVNIKGSNINKTYRFIKN